VTGHLIAPVIPPDTGPGHGVSRRRGGSRPLPLASSPVVTLDAVGLDYWILVWTDFPAVIIAE
jgi:hypothetical protein